MSKGTPWKVFVIFVTVVLALGWEWTTLAKDKLNISDNLRIGILIGITVILALKEGSVQFLKKPASTEDVEDRRAIIEEWLGKLIKSYSELYQQRNGREAPKIRANIMLPLVKWKIWTKCLKIHYQQSSSGKVEYNQAELDLEWKKKEGTCGSAWELKYPCYFDTVHKELKSRKLSPKQREVTKEIKTTISTPMCYNKRVVGVLNLDSKEDNIDITKFNVDEIHFLIRAFAKNIAPVLFEDGMEEG